MVGGDDRDVLRQAGERRAVEVVEVGVGDQDQVELGQFADRQRGGDEPARPAGADAEADADAVGEDGVGEDGHPADAEQHGGVADPGGGEGVVFPAGQVRLERRRRRRVEPVEHAQPPAAAAQPVRHAQRHRPALRPFRIPFPAQPSPSREGQPRVRPIPGTSPRIVRRVGADVLLPLAFAIQRVLSTAAGVAAACGFANRTACSPVCETASGGRAALGRALVICRG